MAGNTEYLTLVRRRRNPARLRQWNASIGNGDDLKLAVTIYDQETDAAPLNVSSAHWAMSFWRDRDGSSCGYRDYGWPSFFGNSNPGSASGSITVAGAIVAGAPGRANVLVPTSVTSTMLGRYRFAFQMQMPSGMSSDIEGELTVLPSAGLTPVAYSAFTLGQSLLGGPDILGGGGLDADGFSVPLAALVPSIVPGSPALSQAQLNLAALLQTVQALPTSLPASAGKLWLNGGVLCVS